MASLSKMVYTSFIMMSVSIYEFLCHAADTLSQLLVSMNPSFATVRPRHRAKHPSQPINYYIEERQAQ